MQAGTVSAAPALFIVLLAAVSGLGGQSGAAAAGDVSLAASVAGSADEGVMTGRNATRATVIPAHTFEVLKPRMYH